jgi:hypothetical protein
MPFGKGKVRLEWEVQPYRICLGCGFADIQSGAGWRNAWGSTPLAGQSTLDPGLYHWRARLRYHPGTIPWMPASRWFHLALRGMQEADLRILSDPGCIVPDEACWLYLVTKSSPDNYPILNFQDPNQTNQRTGWNIRRSSDSGLPKNTWPLIGTNVTDMDAGAANYQYTDITGASGTWFYEVTAYNSYCAAEGPF